MSEPNGDFRSSPQNPAAVQAFPRLHAATRRFSLGTPRNFTVLETGSVAFLRSESGTHADLALWTLDAATGVETKLVDPAQLDAGRELSASERARRERARESAGGIVSYAKASNADIAAFVLGGALFTVNLQTGAVSDHATAEPVFDPRPDPSGNRVAYACGTELWTIDLVTGDDRRVSPREESESVKWGTAEFVAAEEMGRGRGHWWSPDGTKLLATRVDESPVNQWFIADPSNPQNQPTPIRYPAAGSPNAQVSVALLDLVGGAPAFLEWEASEDTTINGRHEFEYLADAGFTPEGEVSVVRQTRDQRMVSIVQFADGSTIPKTRHTIEDDTWVELQPGTPVHFEDKLLTVEDVSPANEPARRALCADGVAISPPEIQVRGIAGVVDSNAIITAWTEPTEVHVFAVPLAGSGTDTPTQLAQTTQLTHAPGVHGATVGGNHIVISSSTPDAFAPEIALATLAQHLAGTVTEPRRTFRTLTADPGIASDPHFLRLGSRSLASALFLPSGHDGTSKLPVLLDPYGGPHAQRVLKNHNSHLVSRWFAEQGFAVLVTDGRGTPGRGPAFEREVWGDLAAPVLADQIDALDAAAAQFRFLDMERVGIRGWSFGGYLAALAVLRAPDRFHAAVAGAPVTTWDLYDTHYTERYLGHPERFPDHYARTDLLNEAQNLTRPLLLIHGLADDNVVAAHTLRLSSALLAHGRTHQVLPLSGVTHMTPQEVVAENLLNLQRDFFQETIVQATRRS